MAISVLQRATGIDSLGNNNTLSATFGSSVTSGSAIIVIAFTSQTNNSHISTPTDSLSNTYTQIFDHSAASSFCGIRVFAKYNSGAGADTVTIAPDGNNPTEMHIYEVAGLASSSAFDKSALQDQSSTGSLDSTSTATTAFANELLLGAFMTDGVGSQTWTAGTGYSNVLNSATGDLTAMTEEKIVVATGTYNATATQTITNTNTLAVILTFSDTAIVSNSTISVSDTITTSETINVNLVSLPNISDSTVASESLNIAECWCPSISDNVVTSEAIKLNLSPQISAADSTSTAESLTLLEVSLVKISDSTTTTEIVIISDQEGNISVSNSSVTSEALTLNLLSLISTADSTLTSESVKATLLPQIQVSDSVATSENVLFNDQDGIFVSEATAISESVSAALLIPGISVTDSISTSEVINLLITGPDLGVIIAPGIQQTNTIKVI